MNTSPFPLLFEDTVEMAPPPEDFAAAAALFRPPVPTGRRDQILVIASRADRHADEVSRELMRRGQQVRRINMDAYPANLSVHMDLERQCARIQTAWGSVLTEEIQSVWMRRPIINLFHSGALPDMEAARALRESESAFHGLMALLGHARWINPVAALWKAENKIRQLRLAAARGLAVPRTLVTTDPDRARAFHAKEGGRTVVKVFRGQIGSPRTAFRMIFTSRVKPEHAAEFDRVRWSPCIFQQEVEKEVELRITVVGDRVFPVEIRNQGAGLDWRDASTRAEYRPVALPPEIESACLALTRDFGLVSAGIDMIREPGGRHAFLELNAHHDWLWLEHVTGLPMAAAFADLLASSPLQ